MKVFSVIGRIFKPLVDVPRWIGWKQISSSTKTLKDTIVDLFVPQKPTHEESFEEALGRLKLSEEDLQRRYRSFLFLTIFWMAIGLLVVTYGIYLTSHHSWHGFIASFAISLVAFAQAFRSNFWMFQIKQRRLGCTFSEWLNVGILGTKQ